MAWAGLSALLSHWRRHPLQLAMLVLGLSLATALWSAVQAINGEARASYARAAAVLGQDRLTQLVRADGTRFDQQAFVTLRRAGWLVSPIVDGELRLAGQRFRLIGIEPMTLPPAAQQIDLAGGGSLARFVTPPGLFFVSPDTATQLESTATPPLRLTDGLPPRTIVTDIGVAQDMLSAGSKLSRLLLWPEQRDGLTPIAELTPGLIRKAPPQASDLSRLTDSFHLNLTAFGLLSFAVGLFIVHAAIGLAFEQRRSMFRTLRALGLPAATLIMLLVSELLILALAAGLAGVALGYAVAALLLPDVAATLRGLYGADVLGTLSVRPMVWAAGVAIAVVGTMGSAAGGLWRVWRLPLLAAAQPRAGALASERGLRTQALAAVTLLIGAAGLGQFGSGLASGFAMLALLLVGAALLLPPVLTLLLSFGGRMAKGVVAQWFWADARQQLPGLSLALMALLLALATNVGVSTMVSSFRLTFVGWLDQRLASELYVTARDEKEAAAVRDWLAPRADAVLPVWRIDDEVAGQPTEIYGVADHKTYRDNWPMLSSVPGAWDRIAAGDGALINEQMWRRSKIELGQTITLPGDLVLPVVGVFSDYGNPEGQVIIGNNTLVAHYPDVPRLRYAVRVAPAKAAALANDLRDAFGLPGENVVDQAGIKAFSLRVFDRTFSVTAALNVLTLGVAGLAIFASLLTLAAMRLPQLAPVWAMGLTAGELARLDLARSLMLALFIMIAAVPVGLGLAYVLLAYVNVESFGWRLPLSLFPLEWLRLGLFAVLAAGLAAAPSAWRLARLAPSQLLKVFAHER